MAKRLYISKIVAGPGGSEIPRVLQLFANLWDANPGDPSRVYAGTSFIADIPLASGVRSFAVCVVDCINHTEASADTLNFQFPDLTMDSPIGSNWTNAVRNRLTNWGFDITGINSNTTVGDALQLLCGQIRPGWNRNNFDIDKPNLG